MIKLSDLIWKENIPFEFVGEDLILQLKGREYSYEHYLKWAEVMNKLPNVWNLALVDKDKDSIVRGFLYGHYNPLEMELEVKRVTIHPDLFTIDGGFMFEMDREIKRLAKRLGVLHVYCVTRYWQAFLRKMPDILKLSKVKILEVI